MLQGWVVVLTSFAYIGLLFAIAYYADRRVDAGRSLIDSPYVYSLSLAVYATAWTFYGSVGRAAENGVGFLPIYIGPTLMIALWWIVMRKILRISKQNRITSLADFVSSRYGKSALLAGVVTVIAVIGIVPYISLQLKAISNTFSVVLQYPDIVMPAKLGAAPVYQDTALFVALFLAAFTILFGTRHLDTSEHHEGMVAAIAFESLVKLVAFIAVGAWVTWGIYNGFGDLFARAAAEPKVAAMLTPFDAVTGSYSSWVWLTILSMLAIMFLPRQFQVAVIENKNERHLNKAIWLFPLYMLAINLFVLPIAFGGNLHFSPGAVDADTYVLTLPMAAKQEGLALLGAPQVVLEHLGQGGAFQRHETLVDLPALVILVADGEPAGAGRKLLARPAAVEESEPGLAGQPGHRRRRLERHREAAQGHRDTLDADERFGAGGDSPLHAQHHPPIHGGLDRRHIVTRGKLLDHQVMAAAQLRAGGPDDKDVVTGALGVGAHALVGRGDHAHGRDQQRAGNRDVLARFGLELVVERVLAGNERRPECHRSVIAGLCRPHQLA